MSSPRISKDFCHWHHFITCTVQHWFYVLDRHSRWNILAESLQYCQKHKGLEIFAYVFMINHIHLIARAPDLIRVLCDFKKFTPREILKNITSTEPGVDDLFPKRNGKYKFWEETNFPKLIEAEDFLEQKADYIHHNPVRKQYVLEPQRWYWSSANPHQPIRIAGI